MPLDKLDDERRSYKDISYEVTVYYDPAGPYSDDERLIVVERHTTAAPPVKPVYSTTPLNPTSILPWKDPGPVPKDQHVESACTEFESRIDEHLAKKQQARV